jgi:hypothetical protein
LDQVAPERPHGAGAGFFWWRVEEARLTIYHKGEARGRRGWYMAGGRATQQAKCFSETHMRAVMALGHVRATFDYDFLTAESP